MFKVPDQSKALALTMFQWRFNDSRNKLVEALPERRDCTL